MTIRTAIVDDEPLARRRIRNLLAEAPDVEVVAQCANGKDAIESLEQTPPQLLFLDIQMPEIDGFDVLQAIGVGRVPAGLALSGHDGHQRDRQGHRKNCALHLHCSMSN